MITPKQLRDYAHSTGLDGIADALRQAADTIERLEARAIPEGVQPLGNEIYGYGGDKVFCMRASFEGDCDTLAAFSEQLQHLKKQFSAEPSTRQVLPAGVRLTACIDGFDDVWLTVQAGEGRTSIRASGLTQRGAVWCEAIKRGLPDA